MCNARSRTNDTGGLVTKIEPEYKISQKGLECIQQKEI